MIRRLRPFRARVARKYGVERMVLFGSQVTGETHRFSDVDLILVSRWFRAKDAVERAYPLYLEWDLNLPVDFLCYTPQEFLALRRRGGIVREALRHGIDIPLDRGVTA